jgi:hypothetical protein
LVNSVLSSLPTFFMSVIKVPPTIVKMIDKYRKHYFSRGSDLNAKKHPPPQAAWHLATRPKKEGDWGFLISTHKMMHFAEKSTQVLQQTRLPLG